MRGVLTVLSLLLVQPVVLPGVARAESPPEAWQKIEDVLIALEPAQGEERAPLVEQLFARTAREQSPQAGFVAVRRRELLQRGHRGRRHDAVVQRLLEHPRGGGEVVALQHGREQRLESVGGAAARFL